MDCLFLPYCNFFFSLIFNWKKLNNEEKLATTYKLLDSIQHLKYTLNNNNDDCIIHLKYFYNSFKMTDNIVTVDINELYNAYTAAKYCEICSICNNILLFFYSMCADVLFDHSQIKKIDNKWLEIIDNIPIGIKTQLTPIDTDLLPHINIHRDTIIKQYIGKLKRNSNINYEDDFLIILKGMSSSSPWIYNNTTNKKFNGGGFFLKWKDFGIVIDPGYNFMDNFHKNGLNISDINAVIITHNHIDHNHDLRILDDMNKCLYCDQKHNIEVYMDKGTYQASKYYLMDFSTINKSDETNVCNIIKYKNETTDVKYIKISPNCALSIFPTYHIEKHMEDGTKRFSSDSFGIKLELFENNILSCVLGYTSDTCYKDSLSEQLKDSDIIIANISGIYEDDIKKIKEKSRHLGYYGCYKLLTSVSSNLKIFLLSEFWSGNDDIRFDVSRYMQKEYDLEYPQKQAKIFATDIGMKISLKDLTIRCSVCGKYSHSVRTIRPYEDFGKINYICEDCIL